MAWILGPKKPNPIKQTTYECGIETVGDSWVQFKAQYYIFALVFLIFDVETVFLFPVGCETWSAGYVCRDGRHHLHSHPHCGPGVHVAQGNVGVGVNNYVIKKKADWINPFSLFFVLTSPSLSHSVQGVGDEGQEQLMSFWNDPLKVAADWLLGIFTGWGMPEIAAQVLIGFLGVLYSISILMVLDIFLVWVERKVVSRFQDRIGPNRVGPFGLIQPFADIIKLLIKEDITPGGADKVVYNIAPMLSMMSVLILWAVVPLAPTILGVDLNIGALYIIAAGAIGTLSIIMAGWSSNNKFALIGAFRQVAVMVSFEIPMLTILLIPTIFAGSMGMNAITQAQDIWYVLLSPLGALIFLIAAIAELGRAPFDMAEGRIGVGRWLQH